MLGIGPHSSIDNMLQLLRLYQIGVISTWVNKNNGAIRIQNSCCDVTLSSALSQMTIEFALNLL